MEILLVNASTGQEVDKLTIIPNMIPEGAKLVVRNYYYNAVPENSIQLYTHPSKKAEGFTNGASTKANVVLLTVEGTDPIAIKEVIAELQRLISTPTPKPEQKKGWLFKNN